MKLLHVKQCLFTYFLVIFHFTRAATHWIVTEDGKVHTQDDSLFQMKRPYDLMSLLQQEQRVDEFVKIKNQIIKQKQEIESDSMTEKEDDDVEQLIYMTNPDCIRAGKPLVEFDLYVGTMVFALPLTFLIDNDDSYLSSIIGHLHRTSSLEESTENLWYDGNLKNLYTSACSNTSDERLASKFYLSEELNNNKKIEATDAELTRERSQFGPNCSKYLDLDFSMTSFEHLPSIRERKQLKIDPERYIDRFIGRWNSYEEFGNLIGSALEKNTTSWILYTLASFYWRGAGNAEQSIECVRRALHTSPYEMRPIPLHSLATILHRARAFEEAAIVLHGAIDITPDIAHSHYTLGNIYATLADYNKSIICYENVLKLAPQFEEVTIRKAAVKCHSNVEQALKAQHDTLERTLEELKDYQRQQELWINYHKKLRSEQAIRSVLIEQKLHYREFKLRQKLDEKATKSDNNLVDETSDHENVVDTNKKRKIKIKGDDTQLNVDTHSTTEACSEEVKAKAIVAGVRSKSHEHSYQSANDGEETSTPTTGNEPSKVRNECRIYNERSTSEEQSANSGSSGSNRPVLMPVTFVLPPS